MIIEKLLIFKLGDGRYACNTNYVDRIIKYDNLTHVPSEQDTLEGLYNHEGKVIKIYNLSKRFKVKFNNENFHKKIIIVKFKEDIIGVIVDEVLEVFNYNKENNENQDKDLINNFNQSREIDFKYVEDMILINGEIVIYISIDKILQLELQESEL